MYRKLIFVLGLVLAFTIFTAGCSTASGPNEVMIESGVIDSDYMGNPNPQLVVEMKLTPAEREGNFEKIPAKTKSSLAETERTKEDDTATEASAAEAPRPKI